MITFFNIPIRETNDKMRSHLKQIVVPFLRENGFHGSLPTFRRINDDIHQVLNIQFNKYGRSFAVNLYAIEPTENFFKVSQKDFKYLGGRRLGTRQLFLKNKYNQDYWFKFLRGPIIYREAYKQAANDFLSLYAFEADIIFDELNSGVNVSISKEFLNLDLSS
jgi:hypothetical protein